MGPNKLLVPGEWKGGLLLTIAAPSITVLCGLFGGWLCVKIAGGAGTRTPVVVLAAVVLGLGALSAYLTLQKPAPTGPRDPNMSMKEIMEKGREPTWLAIFNPIGGAAAVLAGGMMTLSRRGAGAR